VAEPEELQRLWADLENRWPESMIEPSLQRISSLLSLLGDPQQIFRAIHITGTNGKSSTARMTEALLRAQGLRTGLFTSPHLLDPRERMCIDGEPISADAVLRTWEDIRPYVEIVDAQSISDGGPAMSFFEVMTGLAIAAFADAPVDVAVVEVGMGGTWDATNMVFGDVAVITPIDRDHMRYLGDEPRDIAEEKSGIIKQDAIAVVAAQPGDVMRVLQDRCAHVHAQMWSEPQEFALLDAVLAVGGQQLTIQVQDAVYADIFLPLFGSHQGRNAAIALAAVTAFLGGRQLAAESVEEAFANVTSPGRLQVMRRQPTVLVDAAHNPHGIRAVLDAIDESFDFSSLVIVLGVLSDKDAPGMLNALAQRDAAVVLCAPRSSRAMDEAELTAIATDILGADRVWVASDVADAIDRAVTLVEEDDTYGGGAVLITGSVVLVADAMRALGAAR
jgi:dihydrofolate synthase / folylpolyglutamate synthase